MSVLVFSNLAVEFDHSMLFKNLSATLQPGINALVGINGVGKSVLLKVLAGEIQPATGNLLWTHEFYRLDQLQADCGPRIADALGVGGLFDSFRRIERGCANLADFESTADHWHKPDIWRFALLDAGLHQPLDTPTETLSGGERMRLALCGAFMKKDHFLLLDEPGNHLDVEGRKWLRECLQKHNAGCLLVSHDPELLSVATRVFELNQHGLTTYASYQDCLLWRERQQQALENQVGELEKQNKKLALEHQENLRKSASRRQQGEKQRRDGSQGKLLLDARADQAQRSSAREQVLNKQREQQLQNSRQQLLAQREILSTQRLPMPPAPRGHHVVFALHEVLLPFSPDARTISWTVRQGERWRLKGRNGSGKSSLLKALAGLLPLDSNTGQGCTNAVYLDQDLSLLDTSVSAVENLLRLAPGHSITDWRTWLGSLRLGADKALLPLSALSGGERLKVALLGISSIRDAPGLLLLDEPDNHLDTASRQLLAGSLAGYQGAIVLVSHQQSFVDAVAPEHEFTL